MLETQRIAVYVALAAAALVLLRRATVPALLGGLLAAVTLVAGYGLATRLFPGAARNGRSRRRLPPRRAARLLERARCPRRARDVARPRARAAGKDAAQPRPQRRVRADPRSRRSTSRSAAAPGSPWPSGSPPRWPWIPAGSSSVPACRRRRADGRGRGSRLAGGRAHAPGSRARGRDAGAATALPSRFCCSHSGSGAAAAAFGYAERRLRPNRTARQAFAALLVRAPRARARRGLAAFRQPAGSHRRRLRRLHRTSARRWTATSTGGCSVSPATGDTSSGASPSTRRRGHR